MSDFLPAPIAFEQTRTLPMRESWPITDNGHRIFARFTKQPPCRKDWRNP
jgi:hypothetical protein